MVFCGSLRAGCSGIVAPLLKRTLWIWEPKGHNTAATHYPKVVLQDHHPTASYQKSSGWCPQPVAVAKKRRYSKRRPESPEPLRSCVVVPGSRVKVNGEESAKDWPSDKFNSFWRWVFAKREREREGRVDWAHNERDQKGKACSLLNLLVLCAQCNAENVTQQSLWVPNPAVGNTHVGANHWRPACKRSGSFWWRLILSHFNTILSLYIKES